jgi:septum formation protein
MDFMRIILGSSSKYRKQVLENAEIPFESISPEIDEKKIRAADHTLTPVVLSYAKAQAVAAKVTEPAIIIACDQVVICDGNILEKPENSDEVRAWYKLYSNHPVHYVNGLTVFNTETKASLTAQEISIAAFTEIPDSFTEAQIIKGNIFNCSGGIGDETSDTYSTIVQGTRESIIGLPIKFVMEMIEKVK